MNALIWILIVLVIAYIAVVWFWKKRSKSRWSNSDQVFFRKNWERIKQEDDLRMRVMEADKLLDLMMKKRGFTGTMGEKLKKHGKNFKDLDGLWKAHKLRNRLAHEVDIKIGADQVGDAIRSFGKAFRDLGLLD